MTAPVAVEFTAELRQIKTMADRTYNITFNAPEHCRAQVAEMLGWLGDSLRVLAVKEDSPTVKQQEQPSDAVQERRKRKSEWTPV